MNYNYKINKSYEVLLPKLINIQKIFQTSQNSIHKARNELKIIDINDVKYIVKSFKIPHLLNRIIYTFFKDSKAKKSYNNSIIISDFTPQAVGYIEFKKLGLISESYFISEYFSYNFTIREVLTDDTFDDKKKILQNFAIYTYQLHQNNIFHLDYSPGNILIKKDKDRYIFKIVDINRMLFKTLTLDERLKAFHMLWASDKDMMTIIKEYAKLIKENEKYCVQKAIFYSQNNKNFKNFKKRLKGKKVVD